MDADDRRARKLGQAREEGVRYGVFGKEAEQLRRGNGGDKIGGLDSAPVTKSRAHDAAAGSELERLHMRVRYDRATSTLDLLLRLRAVKFAEPDARVHERRVATARKKSAL